MRNLMTHVLRLCRHDFVVVETIDFYDDEDAQLPEPMTQRDVILLNKAAQEEEAAQEQAAAEPKQDGKDDNMEVRIETKSRVGHHPASFKQSKRCFTTQ